MSSIAALALREAILPLQTSFEPNEITTVKVEHTWQEGNAPNQRERSAKMYLPVCDDPSKKELFFYVVDQFMDAVSNERLHLSTGPSRYSKFRVVMQGSLRLSWQTISANQANKTIATFDEDVRRLIDQYFAPSAREDQLEYLREARKPYNLSMESLAARLRVISRLGRFLPGSYDATAGVASTLYTSELQYKRALFSMVPMQWRVKFAETAHSLEDGQYSYSQLTRYMALQEAIEKRARGTKRTRQTAGISDSAGRGRGRGRGRGSGRGRGGRHSGRGYYGRGYGGYPYQAAATSYGQQYPVRNPYIQGAGGGRFGQSYASGGMRSPTPGQAGFQSPTQTPRPITHSPRRPMVRGRGGPPPQLPTFATDDHYYQEAGYDYGPQDHYYHDPGHGGYDDQYYQEPSAPEAYPGAQDHYYHDDQYYQQDEPVPPQEDQFYGADGAEAESSDPPEDHFLQEFGY